MAARSLPFSTRMTCQPYASNRAPTSSLKLKSVLPSMVIRLSSYTTVSLPSFRWPAREAASLHTPSIMSPSLANAQVRWLMRSWSGWLNRAASSRSARAMPTALPTPWPSGPVVVSTPGVWPRSGWPGVAEFHWRKFLISSSERS